MLDNRWNFFKNHLLMGCRASAASPPYRGPRYIADNFKMLKTYESMLVHKRGPADHDVKTTIFFDSKVENI